MRFQVHKGLIWAFDKAAGLVTLKCPSTSGTPEASNVVLLRTSHIEVCPDCRSTGGTTLFGPLPLGQASPNLLLCEAVGVPLPNTRGSAALLPSGLRLSQFRELIPKHMVATSAGSVQEVLSAEAATSDERPEVKKVDMRKLLQRETKADEVRFLAPPCQQRLG